MPDADTFVDLFCGGGAVTHAGMLSGKFKHFIMNDIDGRLPKLFKDCAYGKYTTENHQEWISREDFFRLKDDAYIALCWSFGNNGKDYMYAKEIESHKKALHYACFYNDLTLLEELGIHLKKTNENDIYKRYLHYSKEIKNTKHNMLENYTRLKAFEHLQSLQSVHSLNSVKKLDNLQNLKTSGVSYDKVDIPKDAVVYCDIPYANTNCGKYDGFDHYSFYEWADKQDNIFISEYSMPDSFIPIAKIEKQVLSAANGNGYKNTEYLFTNKRTYDAMPPHRQHLVKIDTATQMNLFDFLK